jgi:hypothetical protein
MVRAVCTASEAPGLNDAWQTWSVRLSGAAPGEVDAVLGVKAVIKRQDGTRQIERQRVRVSGRVVESGIRVLPRSIFFGTVRPGDRCEASILVYGIDGDVEVEAGGIAGLSGSSSAHQGVTQVRVVFEPDVEVDGLLRGQVALRRVGSSEVCVTVPVVVFVKTES